MIGVVIPAHNEARYIRRCLAALRVAARAPGLAGEAVQIVVVLDDCSDGTGAVARAMGSTTLAVSARNVGMARAAGAERCLADGARWLAFTDADTVVSGDWLVEQLRHGSDAVCGTVGVGNWRGRSLRLRRDFETTYRDADGHHHIHGANLGVCAQAYRRVGGFPPLASSEDVALVEALQAAGAHIAWTASPRVSTSARKRFRAPAGFGATLLAVEAKLQQSTVASVPPVSLVVPSVLSAPPMPCLGYSIGVQAQAAQPAPDASRLPGAVSLAQTTAPGFLATPPSHIALPTFMPIPPSLHIFLPSSACPSSTPGAGPLVAGATPC